MAITDPQSSSGAPPSKTVSVTDNIQAGAFAGAGCTVHFGCTPPAAGQNMQADEGGSGLFPATGIAPQPTVGNKKRKVDANSLPQPEAVSSRTDTVVDAAFACAGLGGTPSKVLANLGGNHDKAAGLCNPTEDGGDEDVNALEDDAEKDAVVLEANAPTETRHLGLVDSAKIRRIAMLALSLNLYEEGLPPWRLPVFPPYGHIQNWEFKEELDDDFVEEVMQKLRDFVSDCERALCPVDRTTGEVLPGGFYIGDACSSEVLREEERFLGDLVIELPDGEPIPERSMRRFTLHVNMPEGMSHEMSRKAIATFLWEYPGKCLNREECIDQPAFVGQRRLYVTFYPDMTALLRLGKIRGGDMHWLGRGRFEAGVVPIAPESIHYPRVQPEDRGDPRNKDWLINTRALCPRPNEV
ncbi:hypothetical protein THAOC_37831 [Thalassiosira oceanica]|uniref:Uncharacterized protein n=1 Tax=Thalassiosira oceanica TaxID=159749 RepID=K0R5D5_THAOC|nr:hypothetical protein THAOC_37831 [Thalassiosira oceanica]|eukprot:EJK43701.1 hypothetical protein THAOC_37831 [Thalassiosira oceanica]